MVIKMADQDKPFVKRNVKDSVFCNLFADPENQLKLYQFLHPEDTTVTVDDFHTVTIENILTDQMYNDLGFLVKDRLLFLVEAQSSWSINIIPRIVMYLGESLNNYIVSTGQKRYGSKKLQIPKPEFYVVYTGEDKKNVKEIYSLADEFFDGDNSFIDVKVKILQAEEGMKDIVTQYITFTKILADQEKKYGRTQQAILETIRICIDEDVLAEYLKKREQEVVDIMMALYDQERATKEYGDERAAEGKIIGAVDLARQMNMTDKQIEEYLMKKFKLTKEEAEKYIEPAYA